MVTAEQVKECIDKGWGIKKASRVLECTHSEYMRILRDNNLKSVHEKFDSTGYYKQESNKCKLCDKICKKNLICSTCSRLAKQRATKLALLQIVGNECSICGWNKIPELLELHHLGLEQKHLNISQMLASHYPFKQILEEAKKCVSICSNCHREKHHTKIEDEDLLNCMLKHKDKLLMLAEIDELGVPAGGNSGKDLPT